MLFVGGFGFVLIKQSKDFSGDHGYLFLHCLCIIYNVPAGHTTGRDTLHTALLLFTGSLMGLIVWVLLSH